MTRTAAAVIVAAGIVSAAHAQRTSQSLRVADITRPPAAVVEKCRTSSCYVLTHAELVRALQAAHLAGQRSAKERP